MVWLVWFGLSGHPTGRTGQGGIPAAISGLRPPVGDQTGPRPKLINNKRARKEKPRGPTPAKANTHPHTQPRCSRATQCPQKKKQMTEKRGLILRDRFAHLF